MLLQAEEDAVLALPSISLATDLQKGQFFPTQGQAAQLKTTAEVTGDGVDDVHAQEERAAAIASTAAVRFSCSCR